MKRMLALLLALCLVLSGCGAAPEPETTVPPTTEAPTEPTTEPTEAPTEPPVIYRNPLTGEEIDEPITTRVFGVTISNIREALPHYSVTEADIYMEMFVNGSIIRGLALFADPSRVDAIGSVRSTRYMFTDIATHYDAIMVHAGGTRKVLNDAIDSGVDGFNIDTASETSYSFRDKTRKNTWEHNLFAIGPGLLEKAREQGIETAQDPEKDYGMVFAEDGTPANGEAASVIDFTITYRSRKATHLVYDEELGKYLYHQYDKQMFDGLTEEPEAFENVIILFANVFMNQYGYHEAKFEEGGTGYFACGGKIIPITWTAETPEAPFRFFTEAGDALTFGIGNTYIAVCHPDSPVSYE